MPLTPPDWMAVALPLALVAALALRVRSRARSVAAYLAGGRVAGRYLVTVADGMAGFGLAAVLAGVEYTAACGFAVNFWGAVAVPVSVVLALTGFAFYRYRETRAMTLGQFLERRYSRGVRIAAGGLGWLSAFAGYAIFPAVAARFVAAYCGLPAKLEVAGFELPTHGVLATGFLGCALALVMGGGQVAALATDALQGIFTYFGAAVVVAGVLLVFPITQFREAMLAQPAGHSFVDPFDTGGFTDFNILFILLGIIGGVYNRLSQPMAQASFASAASPHEQKMAGILATWRSGLIFTMVMLLGLGVFTFWHHPAWAEAAESVRAMAAGPTETLALSLRAFLPTGIEGVFLAVLIFLMLTTDTTNLHALGATFVQDVVLAMKRQPLAPAAHLRWLRAAVALSAAGVLAAALVFEQRAPLYFLMALAGALYLSFAGALFLGGLYWSRGTREGAWAALVIGAVLGIASISLTWHWRDVYYPALAREAPGFLAWAAAALAQLSAAVPIAAWELTPEKFPLSGAELAFLASAASAATYAAVSLLTCRRRFDLDSLLHRGAHEEAPDEETPTAAGRGRSSLFQRWAGVDAQFTFGDKLLAASALGWAVLSFGMFLAVLAANWLFGRWSPQAFFEYWRWWTLGSSLLIGSVTGLWFAVGAARDLARFLQRIERLRADASDDGRAGGAEPGQQAPLER
ncbi:MAG: hypothetical protein N2322_02255 [Terrimicrobiaceae bacterium]|nr:hypothetical protein [Terrimicrobiaceae bacterium]